MAITITPNTWTQKSATKSLGAGVTFRGNDYYADGMAYDSLNHRVLLYAGTQSGGEDAYIYANSLMAYDPNTNTLTLLKRANWAWNNTAIYPTAANATDPTPANRHPESTGFDSVRNRFYLGPGLNSRIQGGGSQHPDDMWSIAMGSTTWTQCSTTGWTDEAGNTWVHGIVYDAANDVMVVHQNRYGTPYTWLYSPATNSWAGPYAGGPTLQEFSGLSYDSRGHYVWFFGGGTYQVADNETWRFNAATHTWQQMFPVVSPGARSIHAMDYIAKYDLLVTHGGNTYADVDGSGTPQNDTWLYSIDLNDWAQLQITPPTESPFREDTGTYDSYNDVFVVHQCNDYEDDGRWWWLRYAPYRTATTQVAEHALTKPTVCRWTIDPAIGGWFARLFDATGMSNGSTPIYASQQAWSASSTRVALKDAGVYTIGTNPLACTLLRAFPSGFGSTYHWSPTNNDLMYYMSGTALKSWNVSTNATATVHDFSDVFTSLVANCFNSPSDNDRYHVVGGPKVGGGYGALRYDKTLNTHTDAITPSGFGDGSEMYLSPDGDYMIYNLKVFDPSTGSLLRTLESVGSPHVDFIKDTNGTQWAIYQDSYETYQSVNKANLATGSVRILWQFLATVDDMSLHVSCRHMNADWILMMNCTTPASRARGLYAGEDEIIKVYLDSTVANPHIERIMHHKSRAILTGDSHYWNQVHASASPNGLYLVYGSDWASGSHGSEDMGVPEPYIAWLTPTYGESAPSPPTVTIRLSVR